MAEYGVMSDTSASRYWDITSTTSTAWYDYGIPRKEVVYVDREKVSVVRCEYCRQRNKSDGHWDCWSCGAPLP